MMRSRWLVVGVLSLPLVAGIMGTSCPIGGTGTFPKTTTWNQFTVNTGAGLRPVFVAVADFDGDARLDIVVAYQGVDPNPPTVIIFFQDTTTSFTPVIAGSGADFAGVAAVAVADLDGDGRRDILAACNGRLLYLHSPASPRDASGWMFTTIDNSSGTGIGQWNDVTIGNIDGANGPDIVACNQNVGRVSWFVSPAANIANGTGWTRVDIDAATRANAASVALEDLDGDSRLDVISTAPGESSARVAWYKNPADPVATAWSKFTIGNLSAATRLAVADLNADGRTDVIALNGPGRQIGWYQRPTDATTPWSGFLLTQFTTATPIDVKAADLDGNNQVDVVVCTSTGSLFRWFTPTPGSTQSAQWTENTVRDLTLSPQRFALGDIDADGRPDIIAPQFATTPSQDIVTWIENPE